MKSVIKTILSEAAVFLVLISLFFLLLAGSAAIPERFVRENFEKSAAELLDTAAFKRHNGSYMNSVADNYADAITLNLAWNLGRCSPFISALDTVYYDGDGRGVNVGLAEAVTEGHEPNYDYNRYWHGSCAFVRLLHTVTDLGGCRAVGFAAIVLLIAVNAVILIKLGHADIFAALILSLLAVQLPSLELSLEYQPTFIIALILCPLFLYFERQRESLLPLLAVVAGTATAFFDFLTTETVTILIPLMLVIGVRACEGRCKGFLSTLILSIRCLTTWVFSYLGAFILKWTLSSAVTGKNVFTDAIGSALVRVNGDTVAEGAEISFISPLLANISSMLYSESRVEAVKSVIFLICLTILCAAVIILSKRCRNADKTSVLLILGAIVPMRFLILGNHSYMHSFFTYRALSCTVLAILIGFLLCRKTKNKKGGS